MNLTAEGGGSTAQCSLTANPMPNRPPPLGGRAAACWPCPIDGASNKGTPGAHWGPCSLQTLSLVCCLPCPLRAPLPTRAQGRRKGGLRRELPYPVTRCGLLRVSTAPHKHLASLLMSFVRLYYEHLSRPGPGIGGLLLPTREVHLLHCNSRPI